MSSRFQALRSLAAAALAAALLSASAHASSLMSFRLTNQGSQSIGRIDISVLPPGAVVPPHSSSNPSATGSPLTIQGTSSGFDQSLFTVALGTRTDAQILRLLFGQTQTVDASGNVSFSATLGSDGQPIGLFNPGAVLDFTLSVDPSLMSTMRLQLPEGAAGIVLQTWPLPDTTTNPSPDPGPSSSSNPAANQVPEPATFLAWSLIGVSALALARSRKPARRANS